MARHDPLDWLVPENTSRPLAPEVPDGDLKRGYGHQDTISMIKLLAMLEEF